MSGQDYKFFGWLGHDASSVKGNMKWGEFEPKPWEETDVDTEISHCGICGSDLHMLSSGWGPADYPCCVGHEIIGKAVRVGKQVKHIKLGDRVGIGAQSGSCLECEQCKAGDENYCAKPTHTYGGKWPNGGKSYGGYATHNRAHGHFVLKIPEGLDSADAAPMMCGGITVYSPLKANGCGPGKKVGIVGVGGLGHFAVLFAKALKADEVIGISRKAAKRDETLKLGADRYIATDDDKDWASENARSLDLIISTVSSEKMPLSGYLGLLKPKVGVLIQVGAPDGGNLPPVNAFQLLSGIKLGGSGIGSPGEIAEMLQLAADQKIKVSLPYIYNLVLLLTSLLPWIEERPMSDANQAIQDLTAGKPRYRYVLKN